MSGLRHNWGIAEDPLSENLHAVPDHRHYSVKVQRPEFKRGPSTIYGIDDVCSSVKQRAVQIKDDNFY